MDYLEGCDCYLKGRWALSFMKLHKLFIQYLKVNYDFFQAESLKVNYELFFC